MNTLNPPLLLLAALALEACSNPDIQSPWEITAKSNDVALYVRVAGDPDSRNVLVAIHRGPGMTSDDIRSF